MAIAEYSRKWGIDMRIEFAKGKFNVELAGEELMVMISALGWTDSLVRSDEAFVEYVGWPRERYRLLVNELADACRSSSARPFGKESGSN